MSLFLGIDGGGSKTRALLANSGGEILDYRFAGPTNLNTATTEEVRSAFESLLQPIRRVTGGEPFTTCLGIAGASSFRNRQTLNQILAEFELTTFELTTDGRIALDGAFLGQAGVLLVAGTGSICLGKNDHEEVAQTGGWGWMGDDQGSGSWIGKRALETCLQQHDGRAHRTALLHHVFEKLGIFDATEITTKLYHPPISRRHLSALTPLVLDLAKKGDTAAKAILIEALDALECLVRATVEKVSSQQTPVCFAGGLLENSDMISDALRERLSDLNVLNSQLSPLLGAVWKARHISGVAAALGTEWNVKLKENFETVRKNEVRQH